MHVLEGTQLCPVTVGPFRSCVISSQCVVQA